MKGEEFNKFEELIPWYKKWEANPFFKSIERWAFLMGSVDYRGTSPYNDYNVKHFGKRENKPAPYTSLVQYWLISFTALVWLIFKSIATFLEFLYFS
jgi:hypothetical protein